MLRDLMKDNEPVDPLDAYWGVDRVAEERPWVMLNMVTSVDGATAVDGGSTGLNDQDDRMLFQGIRAIPDVILVGAGTVRAENYRPITLDPERRARRREVGMTEAPTLAIVTGRLNLDPTARVFSDPRHRPTVITRNDADSQRVEVLSQVADVLQIEALDGRGLIGSLGSRGVVLCEGGPTLNGHLIGDGVVDEVALTVAPMLVSGDSFRVAHGRFASPPLDMRLDRILQGDRSLFLRYVRE